MPLSSLLRPEKSLLLRSPLHYSISLHLSSWIPSCSPGEAIAVPFPHLQDDRKNSLPLNPNSMLFDYADAFQVLTRQGGLAALQRGRQTHARLVLTGFVPTAYLAAKIVSMYCGSTDLRSAEIVLRQVLYPSVRVYNALIRGHSLYGAAEDILNLFREMHSGGIQPDHFTFPFVLKSCAKLESLFIGECVHALCLRLGLEHDIYISTSLIDMYVKCSEIPRARCLFDLVPFRDISTWNALIAGYTKTCEIELAQDLFDRMPEKNIISWTSMIGGYSQNGMSDRSLALFEEMLREKNGIKPNWITIMSVLPACAHSSALEYGEKLHNYAISMGFDQNPCILIAFSAMYSRCGNLAKARNCFDQLRNIDRDVIAWNTMITGYSLHGKGAESISTFEEMIESGTHPDEITFIGLLSGCSHSGLLDLGLKYFTSMDRIYSIKPRLQHYACVVDLLGRAGRLAEAKKVIDEMPLNPGPTVWGALLAACRRHRDLEIGEIAAKKLFELEPENTGNFVILSNIYAEERKWEAVGTVRAAAKGKNPGCSWIELDGRVHSFLSGDTSHPRIAEIYEFLEEIIRRIRRDGYMPYTASVLHDLNDEEKEFTLMTHSEKLAVAFGLLYTAPGYVIRVTKNLRICDDCHSAFKFISAGYERAIIVRDINRFHHFEKGLCSCGDYW